MDIAETQLTSGMRLWYACPAGDEPRPLVIMLHERYGPVEHSFNVIKRAAEAGYVACFPDLFHRYEGPRGPIERSEARYDPSDDQTITDMAPRLTNYVNSVSDLLADVHVNEGFAASNRDLSSTLVPLGCQQVALGRYVDDELTRHVTRTRQADLVVFSGIKINKLDDLEQILARKQVKTVIAAGGLALALKAAAARHDGNEFGLGLAGDSTQAKIYIPPERIEQAGAMYRQGLEAGVEFVLPVDFVLGDGTASRTIPDGEAQFDIGPETRAVQVEAVGKFLDSHRMEVQAGRRPAIAFHNGVFGLFEEEAFEKGTREFVGQLKRMTDAGVEVYVGGGEGGTALAR